MDENIFKINFIKIHMKKFSTILMLALAFALVASTTSAAGYTFTKGLKKGSRGEAVTALQTILVSQNLLGVSPTGYYGTLTVAAVKAYQLKKGLAPVGFVGPATAAALNLEGSVAGGTTSSTPGCAVGAMFSATTGMACTTTPGTIGGTSAVVGIATPGVAGTLAASLWTSPSGVTAYKGQAYDLAGYKIQAGASDMAVTNLSFDFNTRFWLYANAITVKDETGKVVGTVSNLNASNFTELTVGSQYRINVPVTGLVVKATQSKYLTLNASFTPVTDRVSVTDSSLKVLSAQIRAVDGTSVTDTQTVGNSAGTLDARTFNYQSTNIGQLVVTNDTASPAASVVQVSTVAQTQNVVLAIYDVKSQNQASTLQGLTVGLSISSSSLPVGSLFSNVQIKVGGLTYSASSLSTSSAVFTNLSIPLSADVYTPITVLATLAQNTNNLYDNVTVSTSLTPSTLSVIDATYNNVSATVGAATLTSGVLSFTSSGVTVGALSKNVGQAIKIASASTTLSFSFTYSLTAGNNPIFVSATSTGAHGALATTTTGTVGTISVVSFRDSDSTNDLANNYFYIAPGQTKTITVSYLSTAPSASGTFGVSGLRYGTGYSEGAITGEGTLSAPIIGSTLIADLAY